MIPVTLAIPTLYMHFRRFHTPIKLVCLINNIEVNLTYQATVIILLLNANCN